jgi:hypothetical protein
MKVHQCKVFFMLAMANSGATLCSSDHLRHKKEKYSSSFVSWVRYKDKPHMHVNLVRVYMSHIFAFALGMFVATYGVTETAYQLDKALQTAKIILRENIAEKTNR